MKHRVTTYCGHHLYNVHVPVGDSGQAVLFQFRHVSREHLLSCDTDKIFTYAINELNKIYTNYGRFALEDAVSNLFASYGFERVTDNNAD